MVREQSRKIAVRGIRDDGERRLFGVVSLKSCHGVGEVLGDFDDRVDIPCCEQCPSLLGARDEPVHGEIIRGDQLGHKGLTGKNKCLFTGVIGFGDELIVVDQRDGDPLEGVFSRGEGAEQSSDNDQRGEESGNDPETQRGASLHAITAASG